MKNDIIVGLDIGSNTIKLVIGQKKIQYNEEKIHIIGAVSHPSSGIGKGGTINSIEDAVSSLSACIEKAERLIGVPITSVWLAFNHSSIRYEKAKGVAIVSKGDSEIDQSDIERAVDSAKSFPEPNNYEIFKTIPVKYSIDNNEDVKDPIGMKGVRLEVEVLLAMVLSSQLNNLVKIVQRVGLSVEDVSIPCKTMAETFLSDKEKELGVALLDIGATTSSLAVYENGALLHFATLAIGSEYITADIALGLKCPITLAEQIKLEFGESDSSEIKKNEEIDISELLKDNNMEGEANIISRKYLVDIIEARSEEIFKMFDEELKKINRSKILPIGVFLSGGGSLLSNVSRTAKKTLSLPVAFLEPKKVKIEIDKAARPDFLPALSMIVHGSIEEANYGSNVLKNNFNKLYNKVGNLFKKIIPR
jgi:cell division protein FtsA